MEFERQNTAPKAALRSNHVTKYITGKESVRKQEK
jgi:hypothetical protein